MRPVVSAVVLVRNGAPWLARCLDGLASQTVLPERLLIVDVASTDTSTAIAQAHSRVRQVVRDVRIHRLEHVVPSGRAIDLALDVLSRQGPTDVEGTPASEWIWVLPDRTAAAPTALERLLDAVGRSPSVGLAGPKVVDAADPRRLVSLGVQVTRTGRLIASPAPGEADQGQHDKRTDVLAVSTSGMLIRRDVHQDLGGFDSAFDGVGADLDLGWRAQLAGHRVIVVPAATVLAARDAEAPGAPGPPALDPRRRRAARRVALARCSLGSLPFIAAWIAVSSLAAGLVLVLAKRPRAAWRELGDLAALLHPMSTVGARWRGRRRRRLRGGDLGTLFVPPLAAARSTIDHIQDAITPERSQAPRESAPTTETGPSSDESEVFGVLPPALGQRLATHPGLLAVVTTLLVSGFAWRDAIRSGALAASSTGVAGGELRPLATDSSGLWHAFWDAWHGAGLGTSAESGPHLAVLAGVTWVAELLPGVSEGRSSAGVTVAWLLFLAPALSAWSAYLASRVLPASRSARAVMAVAWAASSVITTAISEGRLTAALGHVLLPFVVAGFVLAARRNGTYTATFATGLAAALLAAFVPPMLALSSVAALALLVIGPGARRLRALVLLVVPPGLLVTWVGSAVADWRLLLSGPGLLTTAVPTEAWKVLVGHSGDGGRSAVLGAQTGVVSELASSDAVIWAAVPLVLVGLVGYARRGRSRGESVGVLAVGIVGLIGLAAALASGRVVLGSAEDGVGLSGTAHLWAGVGLELWVTAILVGILLASRAVVSDPGAGPAPVRAGGWTLARTVALSGLVVVPVVVMLAAWGVSGVSRTMTVGQATLPAVAVEQAKDPLSNRLLLLRPSDRVVDFVLVGREPGQLLRDLDRPARADDRPLVDAVARLVGGRAVDSLDATELAGWGVGFVQAQAGAGDPLTRRLDATRGLTRLGTSEQGILWKVLPGSTAPSVPTASAPSRLRVVDADGRTVNTVPTSGPHGAAAQRIDPAAERRRLVVAEPLEWTEHAVVSVDGRVLEPLDGHPLATFDLPSAGGALRVDPAASQPWLRVGQGAALAFVVFMALPFGNRRSRRPQP